MKKNTIKFLICFLYFLFFLCIYLNKQGATIKVLALFNQQEIEEIELTYGEVANRMTMTSKLIKNGFNNKITIKCMDSYFKIVDEMYKNNYKSVVIKQKYIKTKNYNWIPIENPEIIKFNN